MDLNINQKSLCDMFCVIWSDIEAHNHWRTMRHKKIPGKKCKGFKDPEGQQAKRQEQLQQKVIQAY